MREIKFRGRSERGIWVHGFLYADIIIKNLDDRTLYLCDKETIGQFTGLKDKNGKEIYEGDIFTVHGKYPKLIKYRESVLGFCIANIDELKNEKWMRIWQHPSEDWWVELGKTFEIIGNIYDNPELLEK